MEAKARDNTERTTLGDKLGYHTRLWLRDSGSALSCKRRPARKATRKCHPEYQSGGNRSGRIFHLAMGVDRVTRALSYWTRPRRGLRHSWHRLSPPPSARHCPLIGTLVQLVGLLLAYHRRCNHRRAVPSLEAQPKYSTRLTVKTVPPKPWKPLSL
jgi:hypothetical protein